MFLKKKIKKKLCKLKQKKFSLKTKIFFENKNFFWIKYFILKTCFFLKKKRGKFILKHKFLKKKNKIFFTSSN